MDIKLSNLLAEHLTRLEALNFSPTTIRSRVYNVRAFLAWVAERYGVVAPHHLNVAHLRSWQKALSRHRTCHGLPLRPRSINKRIECVRGFLTDLNEAGHVPTHMINALQYVKVPDLLPKALTHRQVKGLFSRLDTSTPEGYRDRTMLELLYSSGLRAAELLGLNQDDIDFSAGAVRVMGKGRKERIVPVGETALRFLESYLRGVRSLLGRGNT
ncbi:MAG: tyrosine-type recombinase/integrase, partial [Lentisphaerae bacterium]|nr:tyrosine-type recombinase/integrase [Lentisphaerota bacterium]